MMNIGLNIILKKIKEVSYALGNEASCLIDLSKSAAFDILRQLLQKLSIDDLVLCCLNHIDKSEAIKLIEVARIIEEELE